GVEYSYAEVTSIASPAKQSLQVLIEEVLENNPELKSYEAEIQAAKGLRKTAGLWNNPEVSGSVGQKRVTSSSDGESSTARGIAHEIAVTQAIEWPGRIRLRKAIADRDIQVAELSLEQFRGLLVTKAKVLAYLLTASQEKASATREVADHFHDLREVLIKRDQAGLTPMLETRIIEAMELNLHRKANEASLASQAALFDLNQLRGAEPNTAFSLETIDFKFKPLNRNKEELMALARGKDYQVRMRKVELERQGYGLKLAKNERFPTITAGPAISQERAGDRERIIGASISMPVPLWNRNQGSITVAKAQQTKAQVALSIAERDAERRAVEMAAIYEMKLREMDHWQPDSIQHFKEAAELGDRHYRLGAVPVSIYVELQSQYLDAIVGLQDTKKEALESAGQLEILTGDELSVIAQGESK
ncbi:MAG TPA: transporter, partial [Candidatus Omnitrophica bacterium]|nr:transporter [Candidatus Omnitrophota bacterium]